MVLMQVKWKIIGGNHAFHSSLAFSRPFYLLFVYLYREHVYPDTPGLHQSAAGRHRCPGYRRLPLEKDQENHAHGVR